MTIKVEHIKDTEYLITWDENNSLECELNTWTETDFIDAIKQGLEAININK